METEKNSRIPKLKKKAINKDFPRRLTQKDKKRLRKLRKRPINISSIEEEA